MDLKKTKYVFYFFHIFYILCILLSPFIYPPFIYLQFLTILTWLINDNKCLLTQLENYLYGTTLLEIFYKKKKFRVPFYQRLLLIISFLYNIFIFNSFYHLFL